MAKETKYGLRDLQKQFGSDKACLDFIFDTLHSRDCSCGGRYSKLADRRQYQCSKCRFQIAPTAGTIFHKSDTPLNLWFFAIYLFSNAKSGLSAKELERNLNVTYKTAWRMLTLIRKALKQGGDFLKGDVEMDETYFGGRRHYGKNRKQVLKEKTVIAGALERGGKIRAKIISGSTDSIARFLDQNVNPVLTNLFTDENAHYDKFMKGHYDRFTVNHGKKEYAVGKTHTNSIESFWGHFKRSVRGTHKVISKKYLQSYLDGFCFHANNRHSDSARFASLLGALLLGAK